MLIDSSNLSSLPNSTHVRGCPKKCSLDISMFSGCPPNIPRIMCAVRANIDLRVHA